MGNSKGKIIVVSCGIGGLPGEGGRVKLDTADFVAAGRKYLDLYNVPEDKRIVLKADAGEVIKRITEEPPEGTTVILASGDSLYYGAGASVLKNSENKENLEFYPNITAFQYLCAKAGVAWSGAALFSIHGNPDGPYPLRRIASSSGITVVYCDRKTDPGKLAELLVSRFPETGKRRCLTGLELGTEREEIFFSELEDLRGKSFSGLAVLILLEADSPKQIPELPLGLSDEVFRHENNLITHPEVRSVIISKLRLRGGVMWDLGAGSGSVGIEAAALKGDLHVFAVEKNPDRVEHIRENVLRTGIDNHTVIEGEVSEVLDSLPEPDIVFIGGAGKSLKETLLKSYEKVKCGGSIVVSAVTLESLSVLSAELSDAFDEAVSLSVGKSKQIGSLRMMKSENQIYIFRYYKKDKI